MTKRPKWKFDDRVRLIEPKRFVRCGYPMYLPDVFKDIEDNRLAQIHAAMSAYGIPITGNRSVIQRLISAFAYAEIAAKGFGGRMRSIYEEDFGQAQTSFYLSGSPSWSEMTFRVLDKFHVMTGEYYAPSYHQTMNGDEYEPGGLFKAKHNTILVLEPVWAEKPSSVYEPIHREDALNCYYCVWDIRIQRITSPQPTTSPSSE